MATARYRDLAGRLTGVVILDFPSLLLAGFQVIVSRDGDRVRLFTRRGFDWREREGRPVLIEGEAVVRGADGVSDFENFHSPGHDGGRLDDAHTGGRW